MSNSDDSIKFWNDICSIRKEHNQHAEWFKAVEKSLRM